MEQYGQSSVVSTRKPYPKSQNPEWPVADAQEGSKEGMSRLGVWGTEAYPERGGEPNCSYYMRTGSCAYGAKCRFNHPPDRGSYVGCVSFGGEGYPERIGEQECQYYLRTGTCKFGMSCRFHHPRNPGGSLITVPLNVYGYPLRLGEKECSHYLKRGLCKFGIACKFHHPQPAALSVPRPVYLTVQSPSPPSPDQPRSAVANYKLPRPPMLVDSYVHGASGAVLLHAGVMSLENWGSYQGSITPSFSPGAKPSVEAMGMGGAFHMSYPQIPSSGPFGSNLKQQKFPERPGQPHCIYYMKNGDCKYGTSCKYHHPPACVVTGMYCFLSPLGLPLRPGVQPCKFYLQTGGCKYGPNCKYDHPVETMQYSPSPWLGDIPVATYTCSPSAAAGVPSASFPVPKQNLYQGQNRMPT